MLQNKIAPAIAFVAALTMTAYASDVSSLLQRNTWAFSQEERAQLNAAEAAELDTRIINIIAEATGNLPTCVLMDFKVVDLNADDTSEIIAAVDVSGRGLLRDVAVISRKDGAYRYDTIPAYGGAIDVWESGGKQLLVGAQPAYELSRSDPLITYPLLYSWTGSQCKDVSRENRAYYEAQYLPVLTNALYRFQAIKLPGEGEYKRRRMVELIGWSLATEKLNSMFSDHLVSTNEVAKLNNLMETFTGNGEQDGVLVRKFREAHSQLRGCLRER